MNKNKLIELKTHFDASLEKKAQSLKADLGAILKTDKISSEKLLEIKNALSIIEAIAEVRGDLAMLNNKIMQGFLNTTESLKNKETVEQLMEQAKETFKKPLQRMNDENLTAALQELLKEYDDSIPSSVAMITALAEEAKALPVPNKNIQEKIWDAFVNLQKDEEKITASNASIASMLDHHLEDSQESFRRFIAKEEASETSASLQDLVTRLVTVQKIKKSIVTLADHLLNRALYQGGLFASHDPLALAQTIETLRSNSEVINDAGLTASLNDFLTQVVADNSNK